MWGWAMDMHLPLFPLLPHLGHLTAKANVGPTSRLSKWEGLQYPAEAPTLFTMRSSETTARPVALYTRCRTFRTSSSAASLAHVLGSKARMRPASASHVGLSSAGAH